MNHLNVDAEYIRNLSLEDMVGLWNEVFVSQMDCHDNTCKLLEDELMVRNPDGFEGWKKRESNLSGFCDPKYLKDYIFAFPVLSITNVRVGGYYTFPGGYFIVKRIYRLSEEYARENNLTYLDRVETSEGDFAIPDGDHI